MFQEERQKPNLTTSMYHQSVMSLLPGEAGVGLCPWSTPAHTRGSTGGWWRLQGPPLSKTLRSGPPPPAWGGWRQSWGRRAHPRPSRTDVTPYRQGSHHWPPVAAVVESFWGRSVPPRWWIGGGAICQSGASSCEQLAMTACQVAVKNDIVSKLYHQGVVHLRRFS